MYHALLTNRYLTTRVIPFIAVAAVALCTALVIIVVSVMSGFVEMVRSAGKTLMGDVIVSYPIRGMPHYDRLIDELVQLPEVRAATPVVDSWGLLRMPYEETEVVQVWGVEPRTFHEVTGFVDSLYWRPVDDAEWVSLVKNAARERWADLKSNEELDLSAIEARTRDPVRRALLEAAPIENQDQVLALPEREWRARLRGLIGEWWILFATREPKLRDHPDDPFNMARVLEHGRRLRVDDTPEIPGLPAAGSDAMVIGIHVSQGNERRSDGSYRVRGRGRWWMPGEEVTLTMLPVTEGGRVIDPKSRIFPVANESQFGVYQVDDKRVLIPLGIAQEMLDLDAAMIIDPRGEIDLETGLPRVIGESPPRATLVLVSAAEGISPQVLKDRVNVAYHRVRTALIEEGVDETLPDLVFGAQIRTWEEQNAAIIGPVEKERNLMRILFSIIYFVCAGLVLVIFWAIVYEKTRDIGILRSIGASRAGILWIFVRYGLVVGMIGSVIGLGLAWIVVRNINHIHNALGDPFPPWMWAGSYMLAGGSLLLTFIVSTRGRLLSTIVMALVSIALVGTATGLALHPGFLVWDPKVYYFTEIPNEVDVANAIVTMLGAVVFSVIGALIPAARAADFDPVAALRYE